LALAALAAMTLITGCGGNSAASTKAAPTITVKTTEEMQLDIRDNAGTKYNLSGDKSVYTFITQNGGQANIVQPDQLNWKLAFVSNNSRGGDDPTTPNAVIGNHTLTMAWPTRGGTDHYDIIFDGTVIGQVSSDYGTFREDLQKLIAKNGLPIKGSYAFTVFYEGAADFSYGLAHMPTIKLMDPPALPLQP
jgi:hypothetical protein